MHETISGVLPHQLGNQMSPPTRLYDGMKLSWNTFNLENHRFFTFFDIFLVQILQFRPDRAQINGVLFLLSKSIILVDKSLKTSKHNKVGIRDYKMLVLFGPAYAYPVRSSWKSLGSCFMQNNPGNAMVPASRLYVLIWQRYRHKCDKIWPKILYQPSSYQSFFGCFRNLPPVSTILTQSSGNSGQNFPRA